MAYDTITDVNMSQGLDQLFYYVADVVPIFIPLVLFAFFTIICLGSFFAQKRFSGRGDFFSSFAVAGYVTTVLAFLFSMIPDLVNPFTIAVCVVISIIGTLLLFVSRDSASI